ncbi:hypothetical protein Q0590_30820 [Rhodocytophaga aerolata]|uniref:Curli production assembly/transport component CsgG n=1 Tax=Rhodocytophaga aerolata TaxID=455078 RepID=A0ABT8RF20_9BACT|nr:hypothetical protein [Rhodocytophaga aerolata]MDO1450707.1 hypothetical protein [Rhodocytophaga aerolata]
MKTTMFTTSYVLFLLGFPLLPFTSAPKVQKDKTLLLKRQGKAREITAFGDADVWFMHTVENAKDKFKKSNTHKKEEFAGGCTRLLNELVTLPAQLADYREQTVAVMPIFYNGEGTGSRADGTKYKLQKEAYNYLRKEARELKLQDPYETNALLLHNGVEDDNFRNYTSAELAGMLGVEYIITGTITREKSNSSTFSNAGSKEHTKVEAGKNRHFDIKEKRQSGSYSTTTIAIKTSVELSVCNIRGENIFHQSKESMFSTVDAYKNSLRYLLQRTPVYRR